MAADNSKRNVRSLMSRIRAYERLFKEKEKSPKASAQKGKKSGTGTGEGTGAPDTGVLDTGVLDTGVLDTGVLDTGVLEQDNQAHTAYMNLIKLVHALEKDIPKAGTDEFQKLTRERVREVLRDVYGISTVRQ